MNRKHIFVSLVIMIALIPGLNTAWGQPAQYSSEYGTISGVVTCERGDLVDGTVQLIQDEVILAECYLSDDHSFTFEEVPPGTYQIMFLDLNEIPTGEPVSVNVATGKTCEVNLVIPFALSGLPCDEMLEMGWNGYNDAIYEACLSHGHEYTWLSEVVMDKVARAWGACKRSENDELMITFPPEMVDEINAIRDALESFEWAYYNVAFYGGTGAFHNGSRTVVGREIFIGEIIMEIIGGSGDFYDVDTDKIEDAQVIFDNLLEISAKFNPDYYSFDEDNFREALSELDASCERLKELASGLDDGYMVAVANYVKPYTEMDIY